MNRRNRLNKTVKISVIFAVAAIACSLCYHYLFFLPRQNQAKSVTADIPASLNHDEMLGRVKEVFHDFLSLASAAFDYGYQGRSYEDLKSQYVYIGESLRELKQTLINLERFKKQQQQRK